MAFSWKDNGKIFKGEGIYHLTFNVAGKRSLLGELVAEYPSIGRIHYTLLNRRNQHEQLQEPTVKEAS